MEKRELLVVGVLTLFIGHTLYTHDLIFPRPPVIDFHTILSGCQVGTGTVLGMTGLKKMNDYCRSWKDLAAKAEAAVQYCRLWQQAEASEWQSLRKMCGEEVENIHERRVEQAAIRRKIVYQKQAAEAARLLKTRGTVWARVFGCCTYAVYGGIMSSYLRK